MKKEENFLQDEETRLETRLEILGRKIHFKGQVFTICQRKKNLGKLPKYYLFDLGNKSYISSLYPTEIDNEYIFDIRYDGQYLIRFTPDDYEIEEISESYEG